ncbi:MAG: VOC family protein [Planctomycetes bacterium]|nr:VOC family protein [Planctomycetota bacterium]
MTEQPKPAFGPGSFMWHEHATRDQKKSMDFYSKVFGWKYEEMDLGPNGKYQIIKAPGEGPGVGGMMEMKGEWGDMPSHWAYYIDVEDVDAAVARVEGLGGKVMHPATDIPPGRFAAIQDPTGAHVYIMKPTEHAKEVPCGEPGHFIWVELMARDFEKARVFYSELVGWKSEEMPMPEGKYTLFRNTNGNVGGGMEMPHDVPKEVPSNWVGYIHVADIEKSCKDVEAAGGQVIFPPMEVPNVGRFSHIADPNGAMVAIMQPAVM